MYDLISWFLVSLSFESTRIQDDVSFWVVHELFIYAITKNESLPLMILILGNYTAKQSRKWKNSTHANNLYYGRVDFNSCYLVSWVKQLCFLVDMHRYIYTYIDLLHDFGLGIRDSWSKCLVLYKVFNIFCEF